MSEIQHRRSIPEPGSSHRYSLNDRKAIPAHNDTVYKIPIIPADIERHAEIATCNYAWLEEGGELDPHSHFDGEEFFMFLSGLGLMRIDDKSFPVGPQDVVKVPVGAEHTFKNIGDEQLIFFTLRLMQQVALAE